MTKYGSTFQPAAPPTSQPVTLADLLVRLDADPTLTPTRCRDLKSAVRGVARIIGQPLDIVPASPSILRGLLGDIEPAQVGVSKKSFANIKAGVLAALRTAHAIEPTSLRRQPISVSWDRLLHRIDNPQIRWSLSSFSRFCSRHDFEPDDVDDGTIANFRDTIAGTSLTKNPTALARRVIWRWNQCQQNVEGWPEQRLSPLEIQPRGWTLRIEGFPSTFQNDLERWLARLRGDNLFAEDAPPRPLRPATLKHRAFQVRMFASALVLSGREVSEAMNLAALVTSENFRAALSYMFERQNRERSKALDNLVATLKAIARHYVGVADEDLQEINRLHSRVAVKRHGLTSKNRARLRQFDDPRNVDRLLRFPHAEAKRLARIKEPGPKVALQTQIAAAVELLLMTAIRVGNLAALEDGRHLSWSRPNRKGILYLSLDGAEVKNDRAIDFELPRESAILVHLYLERYRPLLKCPASSALFPGRDGRPKSPQSLSVQIKRKLQRRLGLVINVHLFRHFAAKLYLDEHPGGYEVVRLLAGHKSSETTLNNYVGLEATAAGRHYDEVILNRRLRRSRARRNGRW